MTDLYLTDFQVAQLRTTLEVVVVRACRVQHDVLPRFIVDIVGPLARTFHTKATVHHEQEDQETQEQDGSDDAHHLLPRHAVDAGRDRRGVQRTRAVQPCHIGRAHAPARRQGQCSMLTIASFDSLSAEELYKWGQMLPVGQSTLDRSNSMSLMGA